MCYQVHFIGLHNGFNTNNITGLKGVCFKRLTLQGYVLQCVQFYNGIYVDTSKTLPM